MLRLEWNAISKATPCGVAFIAKRYFRIRVSILLTG